MGSPVLAVGPGQEQAGHTFLYLPIQRMHFGGGPIDALGMSPGRSPNGQSEALRSPKQSPTKAKRFSKHADEAVDDRVAGVCSGNTGYRCVNGVCSAADQNT